MEILESRTGDISCTFPAHRNFGVSGTFPEHRKDGYHMVQEPIHIGDISCTFPASVLQLTNMHHICNVKYVATLKEKVTYLLYIRFAKCISSLFFKV